MLGLPSESFVGFDSVTTAHVVCSWFPFVTTSHQIDFGLIGLLDDQSDQQTSETSDVQVGVLESYRRQGTDDGVNSEV